MTYYTLLLIFGKLIFLKKSIHVTSQSPPHIPPTKPTLDKLFTPRTVEVLVRKYADIFEWQKKLVLTDGTLKELLLDLRIRNAVNHNTWKLGSNNQLYFYDRDNKTILLQVSLSDYKEVIVKPIKLFFAGTLSGLVEALKTKEVKGFIVNLKATKPLT